MDILIYYSASITTGLSVGLLVLMVMYFSANVPEDDRTYMDPLGFKLKLVWPFVQIFSYYFCTNLSDNYLERVEKRLQHTGVSYVVSAEQFVALRIVTAILMTAFTIILILGLDMQEYIFVLFAPFIGFMLPLLWLGDMRKRREGAVIRQMPVYLDFITMAVEAGLNLSGALAQARDKGPLGPLRNEFGIVIRDIRSGTTRADALRRMAERLDITEVSSFVSTIVQAEKMGASMGDVLRIQAEQRRTERFQRAEKMAMEAPVKLVGPLVMFIFPVTFIVIGFPIVMKFMAEGLF